MACALQCPPEVANTLVECYPMGIHMREEAFQRLPLHIACQAGAPIETIEVLIRHHPEACRVKDSIGWLPVHYACSNDAPSAIVQILLRDFPASAGCGDDNGWMPIFAACRRGISLYAIDRLLDCFPQSADMATNKGSTPIMCAMKGGDSQRHMDIIKYLEDYVQQKSLQSSSVIGNKVEVTGSFLQMGIPSGATIHHRNVHAIGA